MIRFKCACGKRVKVPTSAAGKRVRCPFCGKEQRVPDGGTPRSDVPVADVVAGPPGAPAGESPAAHGLVALAQAVKANGGAKETHRNPVASVRNRAKQQDLPTSAQLIARRTGAVADHRKYFLIGVGVAIGLLAAAVMLSLLMGGGSSKPQPTPTDAAKVQPSGETARRGAGAPGEMFKNVPFEKPSESADAAPTASP